MELPKRKKNRLENYDYSTPGAYFVTICTNERQKNLSKIRRGDPCGRPKIELTQLGWTAEKAFEEVEKLYGVEFDYRIIMPDHIHFIVFVPQDCLPVELGHIVGAFKSVITRDWLEICKRQNAEMGKIWQKGYYDHIVRNEQDLYEIRKYIDGNPDRWLEKREDM